MSKISAKQIIAEHARVVADVYRRQFKSFAIMLLFLLVAVSADAYATGGFSHLIEMFTIGGAGVTYSIMAAVGNIDGATEYETTGSQISAKVWLIDVAQVDTSVPFPKANASRQVSTIPMLPGEYMHYFTAIDDTLSDNSKGEKGDITTNVTNTFALIMGGNKAALLNYVEQHAGGRFIIIYQLSSDSKNYILGNPIKPMILKGFERKNDKDSRSVSFNFESKSFAQPNEYVGDIVRDAPAIVAPDATALAITSKARYTTSNNTVATAISTVTGLASADKGRIIEITGVGGAHPTTIADGNTFVLIDGVTFTANAGSRIAFRILDPNTLVEVDGSRVQTA